jgi:uncharacterized integral membrane protein (TIGR00697 family)
MNNKIHREAFALYIILTGIFIACLVGGNLIFQKFFFWSPFSFLTFGAEESSTWYRIANYRFEISVGIIPYPLTFLITDIISEIYGRKKANLVVLAGLFATLLLFLVVLLADVAPATSFSPVNDAMFSQVFGYTGLAILASMVAYLLAQLVDIRLFHFWKRVTKGKMLWVRNNFSTIVSQLIDTSVVLLLLCLFEAIPWTLFWVLLANGFLFKVIIALCDTPLFYLTSAIARKRFNLKLGEEIEFVR